MNDIATILLLLGGGSAVLFGALAMLIVRRAWQERRANGQILRGEQFRAALLPHMLDPARKSDRDLLDWRGDPAALPVATHFLALLRGGERERLLRLVDDLELFAGPVAKLRLSPRSSVRLAAIRALAPIDLPRVRDALMEALREDRALDVRLEAGLALVRQGVVPALEPVQSWLDDGAGMASPAHRIILRAIAAGRPGEMLAAWHAGRHGPAQLALTDALGSITTGAALAALKAAARDRDPQMRCEALRSLRRIGHPLGAQVIVEALDDPEWIVRVQAASAAGGLVLAEARPRLETLRQDSHWWVRYRAEEALAALAFESLAA